MSKKDHSKATAMGPKAMEMVMRDVLNGMEEMATMKGYESRGNVFEILAITPPSNEETIKSNGESAEIIPIRPKRS